MPLVRLFGMRHKIGFRLDNNHAQNGSNTFLGALFVQYLSHPDPQGRPPQEGVTGSTHE